MPTAPAEPPTSSASPAAPSTQPPELTEQAQARLVRALAAALATAGGSPPHHIETHISHVLLHGGHAYKIKKAIATSFLDQSTLALRRRACAEELRLNRRLAPDLYLDAVAITGTPEAPRFGGEGPVLDMAVRMRSFDEEGLWDRLAQRGELRVADIDDLAVRLARFHAEAAPAPAAGASSTFGSPILVRQALLDSLRDLQALAARAGWPDAAGLDALERLRAWEAETFARAEPAMARRLAAGRVRECHGDLHLGNVAREHDHCLVFDGIEFNEAFRWLDVMDEVAFMAMDLHAHGLPALAHRFVNGYLEACGDYDGLRVLGYYLVHRALVRAKVAQLRVAQTSAAVAAAGGADGAKGAEAAEGAEGAKATKAAGAPANAEQARRHDHDRGDALAAARRYFDLALQLAAERPRAMLVTHGLPGSGKTTLTQGLVEAAGAVRVRADIERKRLAGLAPLHSSGSAPGAGLYTPAMNEATQARLLEAAADVLQGGWPVIVDATFIRRAARDEARQCAARLQVPFVLLRFTAAPEVLRARVRSRAALGIDASEADEAVLAAQMRSLEPLQADELEATFDVPSHASADGAAPRADWTPLLARLRAGVAG
ncbi:MAG: AAA family ATPase [Burkholderiales bacterium]|nr:AAA family ATPase [Burkholderiales bacterium]